MCCGVHYMVSAIYSVWEVGIAMLRLLVLLLLCVLLPPKILPCDKFTSVFFAVFEASPLIMLHFMVFSGNFVG